MIYLRKIILKNNFGWLFSFHEIVINFEMFQNDPKAVTSTHKIQLVILVSCLTRGQKRVLITNKKMSG